MDTNLLLEWSRDHRIVDKATSGFCNYLDNWKRDSRDDFYDTFRGISNVKLIRTELKSIQLTHIHDYTDLVYCNLRIMYLGEHIGVYTMVFTLEGEADDDFIEFDKLLDQILRKGTVKVEIVIRAIKAGYDIEEIAALVDLDKEAIRPLFEG